MQLATLDSQIDARITVDWQIHNVTCIYLPKYGSMFKVAFRIQDACGKEINYNPLFVFYHISICHWYNILWLAWRGTGWRKLLHMCDVEFTLPTDLQASCRITTFYRPFLPLKCTIGIVKIDGLKNERKVQVLRHLKTY